MESNFEKQIEQKENTSDKKKIRIIVMRHGEKSSYHGELTEAGKETAAEMGKQLSGATKFYHTFIPRTKQTAEAMASGMLDEQVLGYKENRDLQYKESDGTILLSKEMVDKYNKIVAEHDGDETEAIMYFLSFKDKKPDDDTLSPKESFQRMLKPILKSIEGSKRFGKDNTQDLNLVGVSHILNLTVLLWGLLSEADELPRDFISRIGGPIKYLEDIKFSTEEDLENGLRFVFRGREYFVSSDRLN